MSRMKSEVIVNAAKAFAHQKVANEAASTA